MKTASKPSHLVISSLANCQNLFQILLSPITLYYGVGTYVKLFVRHFWQRWSTEYISSDATPNGTILLEMSTLETSLSSKMTIWFPLSKWETHTGKDGLVRVVTIKTATGNYKRLKSFCSCLQTLLLMFEFILKTIWSWPAVWCCKQTYVGHLHIIVELYPPLFKSCTCSRLVFSLSIVLVMCSYNLSMELSRTFLFSYLSFCDCHLFLSVSIWWPFCNEMLLPAISTAVTI